MIIYYFYYCYISDSLPVPFRHQFLVTSPKGSEDQFNKLKTRHGSFFAYHGSNIENWHSILGKSLKIMSNTSYMANGSAHGKGLYFSSDQSMSLDYSHRRGLRPLNPSRYGVQTSSSSSNVWCNSIFTSYPHRDFEIMGMYEIINDPLKVNFVNRSVSVLSINTCLAVCFCMSFVMFLLSFVLTM